VDIQYLVKGTEQIGLVQMTQARPLTSYDPANDIQYHSVDKGHYSRANNESFFIFFPSDVHRPSVKMEKRARVKKIVVKIRISDND